MNNDTRSIGVIDSGVGGLSVVKEITKQLPHETIVYVGDELHMPYGTKPVSQIKKYIERIIDFLTKKDVKAIVVACNTASAVALLYARTLTNIPIIGVIDGGIDAVAQSGRHQIGLLATQTTVDSQVYQDIIKDLDPRNHITALATPEFVLAVEDGLSQEAQDLIVNNSLTKLPITKIDAVILGCTHFPFLKDSIAKKLPNKVLIIDPAELTVRNLADILEEQEMLNNGGDFNTSIYYSTLDNNKMDTFIRTHRISANPVVKYANIFAEEDHE